MTNSAPAVTQELLDQAFAFGAYQIAMHARFMPEDAISNEQEFEKLIVRCFEKRGTSGLSLREIRQYVNPEKHVLLGGHGPFGRALKNMIGVGRLRVDRRGKKEVWWLVSDDEDEA